MKMHELVELYLTTEVSKKKSAVNIGHLFHTYILPEYGDRDIGSIKRKEILLFTESLVGVGGGTGATARRVLSYLKAMFNWAQYRELTTLNPAASVKQPAKANVRQRVLSSPELQQFLDVLDSGPLSESSRVQFMTILYTACRKAEVVEMQWREVDFRKCQFLLPAERSKNGQPRAIPLSIQAVALLKDWKAKQVAKHDALPRWVFPIRTKRMDKPASLIGLNSALRALRTADLVPSDWHIHDLRRTVASELRQLGTDRDVIKLILGHKEQDVTQTYQTYDLMKERFEALQKWANELDALMGIEESVQDIA